MLIELNIEYFFNIHNIDFYLKFIIKSSLKFTLFSQTFLVLNTLTANIFVL